MGYQRTKKWVVIVTIAVCLAAGGCSLTDPKERTDVGMEGRVYQYTLEDKKLDGEADFEIIVYPGSSVVYLNMINKTPYTLEYGCQSRIYRKDRENWILVSRGDTAISSMARSTKANQSGVHVSEAYLADTITKGSYRIDLEISCIYKEEPDGSETGIDYETKAWPIYFEYK